MKTVADVLKRFRQAKAKKSTFDKIHKDVYKFFLPSTETINDEAVGSNKPARIFATIPQMALQKYANKLSAQLIPFGKKWMVLRAGGDIPEEMRPEINLQLEKITDIIFDNLPYSNFHHASHESFQDLGLSTGVLMCEEGDGINSYLRFRSIPIKELVVESSRKGLVNTVYREFNMEIRDLDFLYPKAKIPTELQRLIDKRPETLNNFIEGVVYNERKANWTHWLIWKKEALIKEDMESSPYIVFREKKSPNETYGRGRGLDLLSAVKNLDDYEQSDVYATTMNAKGMYTVADDSVVNAYTLKLRPGALIPVDTNATNSPSIAPLQMATNFEVSTDRIQRLQALINEYMFAQPFGSIEETPVRTAFEMSQRASDLAETTMATFSRIQSEFLEPLVQRIVHVLTAQGVIPNLKVDGKQVAIKFTSPISRMQDMEDLQNLNQFLAYAQSLPPELVLGKFKIEDVPHYLADKLGLPESFKRTISEQDAMKQTMHESDLQANADHQSLQQGVPTNV